MRFYFERSALYPGCATPDASLRIKRKSEATGALAQTDSSIPPMEASPSAGWPSIVDRNSA